jgi:hypothetical protein
MMIGLEVGMVDVDGDVMLVMMSRTIMVGEGWMITTRPGPIR